MTDHSQDPTEAMTAGYLTKIEPEAQRMVLDNGTVVTFMVEETNDQSYGIMPVVHRPKKVQS